MRARVILTALTTPLLLLAIPLDLFLTQPQRIRLSRGTPPPSHERPASHSAVAAVAGPLAAYAGLASWIDIYNPKQWEDPDRTVARMAAHRVQTVFLQTSTYGRARGIVHRRAVERFIHAAHERDMQIVAWYVPSFTHPLRDFRRVREAVSFRTSKGDSFDSFGLDIEAPLVGRIGLRNHRLLQLSKRLRRAVGPGYPLGAIVPDVWSTYWPKFPYKRVARFYDVFVPMGYFTFHVRGYKSVRRYTARNIRAIRQETGDPEMPVHAIGGIAGDTEPGGLKGFVRAVKENDAIGASLYDFPITDDHEWKEMGAVNSSRLP